MVSHGDFRYGSATDVIMLNPNMNMNYSACLASQI